MKLKEITNYMEELFPLQYAEDFDNVGLLVGRKDKEISKVLICLDCDKDVVKEAVREKAELIITHHPVIFNPVKRISDETSLGEVIITALENNISIYSAHTNADSAPDALTDEVCKMLDLKPIRAIDENIGRICLAPNKTTAKKLCERIKHAFNISHLYSTFTVDREIKTVAVVNGGGGFLGDNARSIEADVYISGDLKHHQFIEFKEADGIDFIEMRHYDSELVFCHMVKEKLEKSFKDSLNIKISTSQRSPLIDTELIL